MCDYCGKNKTIMTRDIISESAWAWGWSDKKINLKEASAVQDEYGLFVDRGYLRFTDLDDCQCLDHGDKVKINFCPFCGTGLKQT